MSIEFRLSGIDPVAPSDPAEFANELTSLEKAQLLEGKGAWSTTGVDRLGIPALFVTDGPHGVRKVRSAAGGFDIAENVPSTAFPTSATVAGAWDPELARRMGKAIGRECVDLGVDILLAPGVNIKRNPLCGRNFEYYSEDPLVSGELGAAFVDGVQSTGVGTSVKHFAANSNENYRFVGDSVVDERALREIYLRQFERVVKKAAPTTVMCAYNAVNGVFSSDNHQLLTEILRDEWGFDGVVMTDWGATHDRVAALNAGCDLDMPGSVIHNRAEIIRAMSDGRLRPDALDTSVERMLRLADRLGAAPNGESHRPLDFAEHAALAEQIARESAVLLANDGTLPLSPETSDFVVIGEMFERMRFQGAGSSLITPTFVISPRDAFETRGIRYSYARGYRSLTPGRDEALERQALTAAGKATTVLFFGGLSDLEESEGFDRESMQMPENQRALLRALLDEGARVVLVLFAGAPVELPFADELAAVLDMYLPGMQGGEATARLLFGEANPCGKLAESWPSTAQDASSHDDWDRGPTSQYYESIYVGYRFYDKAGTALRYPFGHGLSYTTFEYSHLSVEADDDQVTVDVEITNTGSLDGHEIVQLYVRNNSDGVFKADKELRGFAKVAVAAGDSETVRIAFPVSDLAYWDVDVHDWVLENGDYEIVIAASAADERLTAPLPVRSGTAPRSPYSAAVDADYFEPPRIVPASFAELSGSPSPTVERTRRLGLETRLADSQGTLLGRVIYKAVVGRVQKGYEEALALPDGLERDARVKNTHFVMRMMPSNSLRSMAMSSAGAMPYNLAAGLAEIATEHPVRGIRRILSRSDDRVIRVANRDK